MNAKLPKTFALLLFFVSFSCAPAYSSVAKSECYEKIQDFLALQFGENFQQDENIVKNKIVDTKLTMIIDKTPTTNPSRYFFHTSSNGGRVCLVLVAPMANDVNFSKLSIDGMPTNITTRSTGQESNDVIIQYKWINSKRAYDPVFCARDTGIRREFVSCKKILSMFSYWTRKIFS